MGSCRGLPCSSPLATPGSGPLCRRPRKSLSRDFEFVFLAERIFADLCFWGRRTSSPDFSHFCGKMCIEKFLQENPWQNHPKSIQQNSPTHFCTEGRDMLAFSSGPLLTPNRGGGSQEGASREILCRGIEERGSQSAHIPCQRPQGLTGPDLPSVGCGGVKQGRFVILRFPLFCSVWGFQDNQMLGKPARKVSLSHPLLCAPNASKN